MKLFELMGMNMVMNYESVFGQKENKIRDLLSSMKRIDIIEPDSSNQQKSYWILKK